MSSDCSFVLDKDCIIEVLRKSDNRVVQRSFVYSDQAALESFLSFATLCNRDEGLKNSSIAFDPGDYEVHRVGALLYDGDFLHCPCKLFDCDQVFSFCKIHNFDGSYNILDYLSHYNIVNEFTDNWNVMSQLILSQKCPKAPPAPNLSNSVDSVEELASSAEQHSDRISGLYEDVALSGEHQ